MSVNFTWPDSVNYGMNSVQNHLIGSPLNVSKFPIDWEGGGDVSKVTMILPSHVKQAKISVYDLFVVGGALSPVVEDFRPVKVGG